MDPFLVTYMHMGNDERGLCLKNSTEVVMESVVR